jgi:hypothetical protein
VVAFSNFGEVVINHGLPAVWPAGPDGDMDCECLLKNLEESLCRCRVPVSPFQRCDGLTLTVEAVLPALNAQLGILYKMFQVFSATVAVSARRERCCSAC